MMQKIKTTPRKSPTQNRSKDTVGALLDATAHVLTRDGYDRASTNRIAEKAGISIGSLYQYFPSKEALVTALIERQFEKDKKVIEQNLADSSNDTLEELAFRLVKAIHETFARDSKLRQVLMQQVPRVGRLEQMRQLRHEVAELLQARLKLDPTRVRKKNLDLAVFTMVCAAEAILYAAVFGELKGVEDIEIQTEVTDLIKKYLLN